MRKHLIHLAIPVAIILCLSSCKRVGDSIYLDESNVIHASKRCKNMPSETYIILATDYLPFHANDSDVPIKVCQKCVREKDRWELLKTIHLARNYSALRMINEDRWGSFEQYYRFIQVEENYKQLNSELRKKGYTLNDLSLIDVDQKDIFNNQTEFDDNKYDDTYQKWLYLQLRKANIPVGTFFEFRDNLLTRDGFINCYDKCSELHLVDNFTDFIASIFEPNCEYCKEMYWDEWREEVLEEIEEYKYDYYGRIHP